LTPLRHYSSFSIEHHLTGQGKNYQTIAILAHRNELKQVTLSLYQTSEEKSVVQNLNA
jgi:hypothetical protein